MIGAWKTIGLNEVASVFNGKTPSKAEQRSEGHPVLKIRDVSEIGEYRGKFESFVDHELAEKYAAKRVRKGDTLILNAAHNAEYVASKTYRAQPPTFDALATGEWLMIRPSEKLLDGGFVHHWVTSKQIRRQLRELVNGIHLYPKDVARLQIPLPPLAEQKRIAAILDAVDALRAKRREAFAQLDALLQSTFLSLFGDPVNNPMGWPILSGDVLCRRITVGIVVQPASYYRESGVPALRSLNVRANRISMDNLVYFSEEDNETKLAKTRIKENDILLVRTGQPGTAAVVPKELDGINAIDILIASPDLSQVSPIYLSFYFNSPSGKAMALGAQRGQIQKHLNVGSLKEAPIPVPPLPLQQKFATIVESIERQKTTQRAHLAELDALFAALQHRAFRGEL